MPFTWDTESPARWLNEEATTGPSDASFPPCHGTARLGLGPDHSYPFGRSDRALARILFQTVPGVFEMSYRCEICGKEPSYGKTVSFSHKRNNRRWLPNIQRVRVRHGSNTRRARVCTSCIRAGKVEKA